MGNIKIGKMASVFKELTLREEIRCTCKTPKTEDSDDCYHRATRALRKEGLLPE